MRNKIMTTIALSITALSGCMVEEAGSELEDFEYLESEAPETMVENYAVDMNEEDVVLLPRGTNTEELPVITERVVSEDGVEIDEFTAEADEQNYCWVTLNYCVDPAWGFPTCSYTGCSLNEAIYHCNILVCNICGCQPFGVYL